MKAIEKILFITSTLLKAYGHSKVYFFNKDGVKRSVSVSLHLGCTKVGVSLVSYDRIGRESEIVGGFFDVDIDTVLDKVRDFCTTYADEDTVVEYDYSLKYINGSSVPQFLAGRDNLIKYVYHTYTYLRGRKQIRRLIQAAALQAEVHTIKDLDVECQRLLIGRYEGGRNLPPKRVGNNPLTDRREIFSILSA
jgi:hypothetical protein